VKKKFLSTTKFLWFAVEKLPSRAKIIYGIESQSFPLQDRDDSVVKGAQLEIVWRVKRSAEGSDFYLRKKGKALGGEV
jgi:hypothetical protein